MKKQVCLVFIAFSIVFIAGCSPELVFTRGHESALTPQIYRMKADGTQETNISQSVFSSAFPDVSPAGNTIAFSSGTIAGGSVGNVYLMPVNGGERSQLTTGAFQRLSRDGGSGSTETGSSTRNSATGEQEGSMSSIPTGRPIS